MSLIEETFRGRATRETIALGGFRPRPIAGWRGNLLWFFADAFEVMRRAYAEHGPLVALTAGRPELVFAFGPEFNRPLLTDRESYKPFVTVVPTPPGSALSRLVTRNLFLLTGDPWERERDAIAPPFHRKRVERWTRTMTQVADTTLDAFSVGDTIDLPTVMQRYTLETMVQVVFGLDPKNRAAEADRLRAMLVETVALLNRATTVFVPVDLPGLPFRRLLKLAEDFEAEVVRLAKTAPPDGVLAELRGVPVDWLPARLFTLLTAGHETSFTSLAWTLALLAQHPAVLVALTDALRPFAHEAPTAEDLRAIPLLDHVIKESLRLFPPAAYGGREVVKPVELGGVRLPAGAAVVFSHYVTQRLPTIFTNPDRFDPDRWNSLHPTPYEYLPFGGGPRACPGAEFAKVEVAVMLARFLTRFWPEIPDGTHVTPRLQLNLKPHPGLPVRLRASGGRPPHPARVRGSALLGLSQS